MPTIELTDEQADELRNSLDEECHRLALQAAAADRRLGDNNAETVQYLHIRSVLSDILHLLEIA